MLISDFVGYYKSVSNGLRIAVSSDSELGKIALEILEMVTSYAGDSQVFNKSGDLVNAFAAAAYGLGWIDAGKYLGYVSGNQTLQIVLDKTFPTELLEKLEEKTYRYQKMLSEAVISVKIAPDKGASLYHSAEKILKEAESKLSIGSTLLQNDMINALVEFSYGYGWLDCGLRSGLFVIMGNRHLFTI